MKIVAVVQTRMGSTRLPGKVLMDIGGATCLARVVRRLSRAKQISQIVIATTTSIADDVIVRTSQDLGVGYFRGSEQDVLSRYVGAAEKFCADAIVRITSDCPLIDPEIVDRVVVEAVAAEVDYASNCSPRTYPRGLDTEFVTSLALHAANPIADQPHQREHATPIFNERPDLFRTCFVCGDHDYSQYRWTLDTPEDLQLIRAIYARFNGSDDFSWQDVISLMKRSPCLASINAHIVQKPVHQVEAIH